MQISKIRLVSKDREKNPFRGGPQLKRLNSKFLMTFNEYLLS
jgi:hypothetical protein